MITVDLDLSRALVERAMARLRRGFRILAVISAALCVVMTIVSWINDAELRAHGYASTFDGLLSGVILVVFCLLSGEYFIWIFSRRARRLLEEGRVVVAKTVGVVSAWNAELLPSSGGSPMAGFRGLWISAMRGVSTFLPAMRLRCELQVDGRSESAFVATYCDEKPLRVDGAEVLLFVSPGRVAVFPSPILVSADLPRDERQRWLDVLERARGDREPVPASQS